MWIFGKKWECAVCGEMHPDQDKFCRMCGTPKRVHRERYDVFISYRRDGGGDAAAVVQLELEKFGKSVFLDVLELQVGRFDEQILQVIETSDAFVLVLSSGCLDRCVNRGDWLKREVMHALKLGKRIIPVHLPGFVFPGEETFALLPREMGVLPNLQAVEWDTSKRDATIRKLVQAMVAPYSAPEPASFSSENAPSTKGEDPAPPAKCRKEEPKTDREQTPQTVTDPSKATLIQSSGGLFVPPSPPLTPLSWKEQPVPIPLPPRSSAPEPAAASMVDFIG